MKNKLIFTGFNITDADLYKGVTFSHNINAGDELVFGIAGAAQVTFTVSNENNDADKYNGKSFTYQIQQPNDTAFRTIGIFNVSAVKKSGKIATITAFDNISKFDICVDSWLEAQTFPMTLSAMATSLCGYCGVTLSSTSFPANATAIVNDNFTASNITGRDILQYIAQEAAGFAICDAAGQVVIRTYAVNATAINNTKYTKLTVSEFAATAIDKVQVSAMEDDIGVIVGTGNNTLVIQNNPLLYAETDSEIRGYVTNIYNTVSSFTYTPMTITLLEDYSINCGDIILVNNIQTMIMSKKITASNTTLSSVGVQYRVEQEDKVNNEINALRGKYNKLTRTVETTVSELGDAQGNISTLTQTTSELSTKITNAEGNISTLTQTVDGFSASIQTANNNANAAVTKANTLETTVDGYSAQITAAQTDATTALNKSNSLEVTVDGYSAQITAAQTAADKASDDAANAYNKSLTVEATVNGLTLEQSTSTADNQTTTTLNLKSGSTVLGTTSVVGTTSSQASTIAVDAIEGITLSTSSSTASNQTTNTITMKHGTTTIGTTSIIGTTAAQSATIAASAVNGITMSVTNGDKSSTIKLMNGYTTIASGVIEFTGIVTFNDLSTSGKTTINGANITTGTISADRIDTNALAVKKVFGGSTGSKIVIDCSDGNTCYIGGNTSGNSISNIYIKASSKTIIGSWGASSGQFEFTTGSSFAFYSTVSSITSLGTSNYPWGNIYFNELHIYAGYSQYVHGYISVNNYIIEPSNSTNLGTTSKAFQYAYFQNMTVTSGQIQLGTNTSASLGFFGTSPKSRQSVSNSATVATLITALKNYGLIY